MVALKGIAKSHCSILINMLKLTFLVQYDGMVLTNK